MNYLFSSTTHKPKQPNQPQSNRLRSHIPREGSVNKALNYWDVFLGESSFYFILECNLSFLGRSHQNIRKCNDRLDVNKIPKTVLLLHLRTEWYCRIPLCPEMYRLFEY